MTRGLPLVCTICKTILCWLLSLFMERTWSYGGPTLISLVMPALQAWLGMDVHTRRLVQCAHWSSKFLSDSEKETIVQSSERNRPSVNPSDHFSHNRIIHLLRFPHAVLLFVMFFMLGATLYGLVLFLPSRVNPLGFSPNKSQLLSVGPFAAGFSARRQVSDNHHIAAEFIFTQ
ncbi:hypothetical protein BDQ17DRAFT_81584 [Cyathus striatus]|nr:hypothetical protein BDQ17DRAFT_81584 [Cyathus striatus]